MLSLQWIFVPRPTAFHAVAGIDAGILPVNVDLGKTIAKPLIQAIDQLRVFNVDRPSFWRQLITDSATSDSTAQIVAAAFKRALGPIKNQSAVHSDLTRCISTIVDKAQRFFVSPQELQTRSQPLQNQWLTYGPGLLQWMITRTEQNLLVDHARIIVVQPVFGGGGSANLHANAAHIEAMMVNPDDTLPEVLRLAWMVAQLHNDLPVYSESINRRLLHVVSGLAMLPVTLEAGAELGLAGYNRSTLQHAIEMWHVLDGQQDLAAEIVDNWWLTVTSGSFTWSTALQALDRMLRPLICAAT